MEFDLKLQQFVDWKVYNVTSIKKKYGYRVLLIYADGSEISQQKSGFETKKAANTDRDKTIGELYSGTYVVYANVKVKDFMLFWLEKEMRSRITSDSYVSYANIVKNHIIPMIGTMKMTELNRGHVQTLYNEEAAVSVWSARQVKTVMNTSMRYAVSKKIISVNPTSGVELPKRVEKQKCCSTTGKPRSKDFHWSYYKKLLSDNHLPDIRWHDLRSTFCTLLLKNNFNPKAVSKLMGHAKELITMDVYGDNRGIIEDCVDEIQPFIDEVIPVAEEDGELKTENMDIVISAGDYF